MTSTRERIPVLSPNEPSFGFLERMRLHWERMRRMRVAGPQTPEAAERLNRIVAGEE